MNFETLKKSHLKRNILIGIVTVLIISTMILNFTRAKYKITQSIPLVNGTINYTPYDFKMIAMYQENDNGDYVEIDKMPSSGYTINEEKSYCEVNGEKDLNAKLATIDDYHTIANLKKGSKCYLYFDKKLNNCKANSFCEKLLADNPTKLTRTDFSTPLTTDNIGTLYTVNGNLTEDGSTVYYFAGNALNNWVKFGKFYWRIIRTNEDGSIRLLFSGTSPSTTTGYITPSTFAYNTESQGQMYVGYMYGTSGSLENNRKNTVSSTIKTNLENWYKTNLNNKVDTEGNSYDTYISKTAIYCNDRATDNTYKSSQEQFFYAAKKRLEDNKQPSYKCGNNSSGEQYSDASIADKFSVSTSGGGNGNLTYSIALMTADEVAFAGGGFGGLDAKTWYYYNSFRGSITGKNFWWTMSPYTYTLMGWYSMVAIVSGEYDGFAGGLTYGNPVHSNNNQTIRPVISLKGCAQYKSGDGSSSNPYEVSITSTCASAEN